MLQVHQLHALHAVKLLLAQQRQHSSVACLRSLWRRGRCTTLCSFLLCCSARPQCGCFSQRLLHHHTHALHAEVLEYLPRRPRRHFATCGRGVGDLSKHHALYVSKGRGAHGVDAMAHAVCDTTMMLCRRPSWWHAAAASSPAAVRLSCSAAYPTLVCQLSMQWRSLRGSGTETPWLAAGDAAHCPFRGAPHLRHAPAVSTGSCCV